MKEYKTVKGLQSSAFDQQLNVLAAQGWEVVGGLSMTGDGYYAVLMVREKPAGV